MQPSNLVYPYTAKSPVDKQIREFKGINDVYDELIRCYDQAKQEGYPIGEALYTQHFFFANSQEFVSQDAQIMIQSYTYCKDSGTPPFRSLNETPADFIDNWGIIKEEINANQ
jgi:hypothetical protein